MRQQGRVVRLVAVAGVVAALFSGGAASALAEGGPASGPDEGRGEASSAKPGDVITDSGVSVVVPPPGNAVSIEAFPARGEAHQELTVTTEEDGSVFVHDFGPEGSSGSATGPINLFDNGCDDGAYNLDTHKWYSTLNWYFNTGSRPGNLTLDETVGALRRGTTNITQANNDCGFSDDITATASYKGTTSTGIQISSTPSCGTSDGTSVVKWGALSSYLAVTCTWRDTSYSPDKATAADIRFSTSFGWETDQVRCVLNGETQYMIEDVMTHERGHNFGIAHVSESNHEWLTMSTNSQGPCDLSEATLGLGDYRGLNQRY